MLGDGACCLGLLGRQRCSGGSKVCYVLLVICQHAYNCDALGYLRLGFLWFVTQLTAAAV